MTAVDAFNAFEVMLWTGMGTLLIRSRSDSRFSWHRWVAGVTLLLFAGSDAVEFTTGAWWKPWWLLLWKVLCVICLAVTVLHARRRLKATMLKP